MMDETKVKDVITAFIERELSLAAEDDCPYAVDEVLLEQARELIGEETLTKPGWWDDERAAPINAHHGPRTEWYELPASAQRVWLAFEDAVVEHCRRGSADRPVGEDERAWAIRDATLEHVERIVHLLRNNAQAGAALELAEDAG